MRHLIAGIAFVLPFAALAADPKTAVLDVQNMTCGMCPITVKQALQKSAGRQRSKGRLREEDGVGALRRGQSWRRCAGQCHHASRLPLGAAKVNR